MDTPRERNLPLPSRTLNDNERKVGLPRYLERRRATRACRSDRARAEQVRPSFLHLTSMDEGRCLASLKQLLRIEHSEKLDHLRHQSCPSPQVVATYNQSAAPGLGTFPVRSMFVLPTENRRGC